MALSAEIPQVGNPAQKFGAPETGQAQPGQNGHRPDGNPSWNAFVNSFRENANRPTPSPMDLFSSAVDRVRRNMLVEVSGGADKSKADRTKAAKQAVDALFDKPEDSIVGQLRSETEKRAAGKLSTPTRPQPKDLATPESFLNHMLNDVTREVQSAMQRGNGRKADLAAKEVFASRGSNSLSEVKHIIAAAAAAEPGMSAEDAIEGAIEARQQKRQATRHVGSQTEPSIPGTLFDPRLEHDIREGKIGPKEFVKVAEAKRADSRASLVRVPTEKTALSETTTPVVVVEANSDGQTSTSIVELTQSITLKEATRRKEQGFKPEGEDVITVIRRTSEPLPEPLATGLNTKEITPGPARTAELVTMTASSHPGKAVRDVVDVMNDADKLGGVLLVNVPAEVVDAGVFEAIGTGTIHGIDDLGDRKTVLFVRKGQAPLPQAPTEQESQSATVAA